MNNELNAEVVVADANKLDSTESTSNSVLHNSVVPETVSNKPTLAGVTELLKSSWAFYKENFKKLWVLFLFGGMGSLGSRLSSSDNDFAGAGKLIEAIPLWAWALIITAGIILTIFLFLSQIALFKAVSDVHKGQFVSIKDSYTKAGTMFWSFLLLAIILFAVAFGSFLLLIVPGIILSGYLIFSHILFFTEDKRGFAALTSSWQLVKGNWWKLLGRLAGLVLLMMLGIAVCGLVLAFLAVVVGGALMMVSPALAIVLGGIVALACIAAFFLFVKPFAIIFLFKLYFSMKVVKDAEPAIAEEVQNKLQSTRKKKLIACVVVAVLAIGPIGYGFYKLSNFLNSAISTVATSSEVYVASKGNFSVNFPVGFAKSPIKLSERNLEVEEGTIYQYSFQKTPALAVVFEVAYSELPSKIDLSSNPNEALKTSMDSVVSNYRGELIYTKPGTYLGYPSNEYLVLVHKKSSEMFLKSRNILVGQKFYNLLAIYPKDKNANANSKIADAFFDSFKLNGVKK